MELDWKAFSMTASEVDKERETRAAELSRKFGEEAKHRGISEEQLLENLRKARGTGVSAESKVDLTSQITETVIKLYAEIPQVEAIYVRQSDIFRIWIFSSESEYDSFLMDKLVSQESTLLEKFDADILVRHVPSVLYPNHRDVVGAAAELIYKR
jgi:hypothetical protein